MVRQEKNPNLPRIRISAEETKRIRDDVIDRQTPHAALLGGLAGAAAGVAVYLAIVKGGVMIFLAFLLPGTVAGYVSKLTGRVVDLRYRFLVAAITLMAVWVAGWTVHGTWVTLMLAVPNAVLAFALSRRPLSKLQEYAIYRYRMRLE